MTGDPLFDGRPDLYRMRRHGSLAQLIMLDARSFRDTELPGVTNPLDPVQIGAFVLQSFDINPFTLQLLPPRTMLGGQQLARLKADLLDAQQDGVVWKFVMVNEPIQNLGVLAASDRFEGYSRERSEILQFIDDNAIDNVVFVTADIHGTLINNLTYQTQQDVIAATIQFGNPLAAPQNETSSFEISTGSVAFDPPFSPTVLGLLAVIPGGDALLQQIFAAVGVATLEEFLALPDLVKNIAMEGFLNAQLAAFGYSPLGLDDASLIQATGPDVAVVTFTFGWTSFEIDPHTRALVVKTYGIESYSEAELLADPAEVTTRTPTLRNEFSVEAR